VLIVEDDRDAGEVLQHILKRAGASVDWAESARGGLEKLGAEKFDILISDISMPEMDGYDLIRRVRETESDGDARIPAIALTAFANKDDREEALRCGYQLHLAKPVAADELTSAVAGLASVTNR
jgi:CheY-like chemotaxis protein